MLRVIMAAYRVQDVIITERAATHTYTLAAFRAGSLSELGRDIESKVRVRATDTVARSRVMPLNSTFKLNSGLKARARHWH